jgi:hypothetical protein
MSHFTTVETKINDLVCLKAALEDLAMTFEEATVNQLATVKGWRGAVQQADLSIHVTGKYDIGVRQNQDGTYQLSADWWGIEEETNEKVEKLQQKIIQRYAFHKAKNEAEKQGFVLDDQTVEADGTIKLTISKSSY